MLIHKRIGRESEALLRLALRVKFDKVFCNVLDFALCGGLEPLPGARPQLVDGGHFGVFAFVFRYAVQRVNAHEKHVVISVNQFDRFLILAVDFNFLQSTEPSDAVVDVNHVIAYVQII